jgi:hypothetical protein
LNEGVGGVAEVALGAGLAAGWRGLHIWRRQRRPAARLWAINAKLPVHIVTAQDDSDRKKELTAKVFPAEYIAAVEIRSLLCETLKHPNTEVHVSTSEEFLRDTSKWPACNLISIGGPVHNPVTRRLLADLKPDVRFEGYAVVSGSERSYEAVVDDDGEKILVDYGVVVLGRNHRAGRSGHESAAVLVMGSRTFGCAAGSRFLTQSDLRDVHRHLGTGDLRWAIVEAEVINDFVVDVKLIESCSGERIQIHSDPHPSTGASRGGTTPETS